MKVRRIVAKSLPEAIMNVKTELGKDAVILHTRKFKKGGFMGLFAQEMVEVTAAADDSVLPIPRKEIPVYPHKRTGEKSEDATLTSSPEEDHNPGKAKLKELTQVQHELQEMKQMMGRMLREVEQTREVTNYPLQLERFFLHLRNQEVEEQLAAQLVKTVANDLSNEELQNQQLIRKSLEELIQQLIGVASPIQPKAEEDPKIIFLMGPTGVGKTTTLAKLAAHFSLIERKSLALITIDTYRIAAIEQLKTYGKIMGIPVEVVFTPEALQESIRHHEDKELILVDTAGRSHRNQAHMQELRDFINYNQAFENYLVLSACTRYQDMLKIYKSFSSISVHKLIFTKLDEAEVIGALLNMVHHTRKPLSYITNGQNVPDDIKIPDPQSLAQMIMGEIGEEIR